MLESSRYVGDSDSEKWKWPIGSKYALYWTTNSDCTESSRIAHLVRSSVAPFKIGWELLIESRDRQLIGAATVVYLSRFLSHASPKSVCSYLRGVVHRIWEFLENQHAPDSAIGTSEKFLLNRKNLFSTEIIILKRWSCGKFYLLWGKQGFPIFDKLGTLSQVFSQCQSICGFAFFTVMSSATTCAMGGWFLVHPKLPFVRWSTILPNVVKTGHEKCATAAPVGLEWNVFCALPQKTVVSWGQSLSRKIPTLSDYFSGAQIFLVNEGIKPHFRRRIRRNCFFRIFLTWNGDIVENGRTIFSQGSFDLWVVRHQNVNTWRRITMHPTKEGYLVCQLSHRPPRCASMCQC